MYLAIITLSLGVMKKLCICIGHTVLINVVLILQTASYIFFSMNCTLDKNIIQSPRFPENVDKFVG